VKGRFLHWVVLAFAPAWLVIGCGGPVDPPQPSRPPNLLVYLVDTLRSDHLGVYGYERDTSPRLDAFARDAIRFDQAYSTTSWTRPAVASLLTGVSPRRHGAVTRTQGISLDRPVLAEMLADAGYHTAAFVTNPNVLPIWGFGRGFEVFRDVASIDKTGRADQVNAEVFQYLETSVEPFFLYVHTRDPHGPYDPPAPFDAVWPRPSTDELESPQPSVAARARMLDRMADYDGEVRFNDQHFGELLDLLRERGLYDDTLIVFTSDHGEEFRDHGELGHGHTLFQEQVRVPLLVKLPGSRHAGAVTSIRVSLLDVAPTLLAAAGSAPDPSLEGTDLATLVADPPIDRALFFDLNLWGATPHRIVAEGVVKGPLKLVRRGEPRRELLLFDLEADPDERSNLAVTRRETALELAGLLDEERARSAGLHFWVVNGPEETVRTAEGLVRTSGRITVLHRSELEPGDEAGLKEGGRELHFRLRLENQGNPIEQFPARIVDRDVLTIRVDPADAPVFIERFELDGVPGPVHGGARKLQLGPLPVRLDRAMLGVERMETLFPVSFELSLHAAPGLYVGLTRGMTGMEVEIDPELRDRLRALGYGG